MFTDIYIATDPTRNSIKVFRPDNYWHFTVPYLLVTISFNPDPPRGGCH